MAQVLYIKEIHKDPGTGKDVIGERKVLVARAWANSSGAQVFLHLNGTYGYKDGAPVKDIKELDVITDPIQHERAVAWWNLKGERMARDAHNKKQVELEKRAMDPDEVVTKMTDLDTAQYIRRPKNNKSPKAFCEPNTWVGYEFSERPPWWGLLEMAEDAHYHYRLINPEVLRQVAEEAEKEAALG